MKILLISPPYATTEPPQMPMGLLYISAVLEQAGHEVRVLDLLVSSSDRRRIQKTVEQFNPAIAGTTSVTMNWPDASRILNWIKETSPDIITVAGGPHVTFTWQEIGEKDPWIDYVVLGEGEVTVLELVSAIEKKGSAEHIAGLAWRENNMMKTGPSREFIKDISALPRPARHLFPLSRYRAMGATIGVTTGRGCPFSCIFCVGPKMVGHKARLMEPVDVADQIEDLVGTGFRSFAFSDDHFGMNRAHAIAVCDEIISRNLDIRLNIFIRADAVESEILKKMREAGCRQILYGAESGVQEIVNRIRKKTDLIMLKEKVKLALDMGFTVQVSFILGLPGETPETIKQTFDYAHSLGTFAGIHVLAPLPGSDVFEKAGEFGLTILHQNWSLYDANHVVSETSGLNARELEKFFTDNDKGFEHMDNMEKEQWQTGALPVEKLEHVELRRRMRFFFTLMKNGFFESNENMVKAANPSDAYACLAHKAALHANVDDKEADKWISLAMNSGDLTITGSDAAFRFAFADDERLNMIQEPF